jgi:hypothetical protein
MHIRGTVRFSSHATLTLRSATPKT